MNWPMVVGLAVGLWMMEYIRYGTLCMFRRLGWSYPALSSMLALLLVALVAAIVLSFQPSEPSDRALSLTVLGAMLGLMLSKVLVRVAFPKGWALALAEADKQDIRRVFHLRRLP